ncbi:MAG: hypothetical protein JXL97_08165 [Bacteroidales bacterium]|nr:hypothetical protein [Bacteroidales bacterium]
MNTLLLLGINALATFFLSSTIENENNFPRRQDANEETFLQKSDYVYSETGQLVEHFQNEKNEDRFFVLVDNDEKIEINLTGSKIIDSSSEIGYLARILAAEALIYEKDGFYYNISMFTRICIAESIKNRKNSDFGFYKNYNSYRNIIFYTGYATNAKEFKETHTWLKNTIAKKRFVEEVLPVAIYVYFNDTYLTSGATGFITPAKLTSDMYQRFQKRTIIEIENIDPYYEFTFWKY